MSELLCEKEVNYVSQSLCEKEVNYVRAGSHIIILFSHIIVTTCYTDSHNSPHSHTLTNIIHLFSHIVTVSHIIHLLSLT